MEIELWTLIYALMNGYSFRWAASPMGAYQAGAHEKRSWRIMRCSRAQGRVMRPRRAERPGAICAAVILR